ncbi:4Fe-4S dicluster domain-containing protein [Candidatus Harpocratesius sp.]
MKWPIIKTTIRGTIRSTCVEYIQKIFYLEFDSSECKFCNQCIKACPKKVLEKGVFNRNSPTMKIDRLPQMKNANECIFCGTCMYVCPFNAIKLKINQNFIEKEDLQLVKGGILPKFKELKVGKVVLTDPNFTTPYWERIAAQILRKS